MDINHENVSIYLTNERSEIVVVPFDKKKHAGIEDLARQLANISVNEYLSETPEEEVKVAIAEGKEGDPVYFWATPMLLSGLKKVEKDSNSQKKNLDEEQIMLTKKYRKILDDALQGMREELKPTRELSLSITNCQQSIMWLGMNLKELGTPNPYPQSYNPENSKVEPTADGLKL